MKVGVRREKALVSAEAQPLGKTTRYVVTVEVTLETKSTSPSKPLAPHNA